MKKMLYSKDDVLVFPIASVVVALCLLVKARREFWMGRQDAEGFERSCMWVGVFSHTGVGCREGDICRISSLKRLHFRAFYALLNRLKSVTFNRCCLAQWFACIVSLPAKNWGSYSSGSIHWPIGTQLHKSHMSWFIQMALSTGIPIQKYHQFLIGLDESQNWSLGKVGDASSIFPVAIRHLSHPL